MYLCDGVEYKAGALCKKYKIHYSWGKTLFLFEQKQKQQQPKRTEYKQKINVYVHNEMNGIRKPSKILNQMKNKQHFLFFHFSSSLFWVVVMVCCGDEWKFDECKLYIFSKCVYSHKLMVAQIHSIVNENIFGLVDKNKNEDKHRTYIGRDDDAKKLTRRGYNNNTNTINNSNNNFLYY